MKRLVLAGVATAAVALFGSVSPVEATPITYTEAAMASGALDGHSFTNALVTITFLGDTSNVGPMNGCGPCLVNVSLGHSVTVTVAGVGTDTFTDPIGVIDFPFLSPDLGGMAGVAWVDAAPQTNGILLVPTITNVFLGYDLRNSIGPVSGSGQPPPGGPVGATYSTTLGTFEWTYPVTSTFTASVPEPATLTLTALGLAGVVIRYRRRRSAPRTMNGI